MLEISICALCRKIYIFLYEIKPKTQNYLKAEYHWPLFLLWQGLTATGVKKGQIFVGDISTQYRSGKTIVDVKVDTYSNVRRSICN